MTRPRKDSQRPLPPGAEIDAMTAYIYRHYRRLLTPEELAAERVRGFLFKAGAFNERDDARHAEFWRMPEIEREFPSLVARIQAEGVGGVMAAARDRVLREHADKLRLTRCPKCNALCRTPAAKQCLACGHRWDKRDPRPGARRREMT